MFESHYQQMDRIALSGGWARVSPTTYVTNWRKTAAFAHNMADAALKDLELLPQDEPEDPEVPGPSN
jgi:hypothetical protein